MQENKESVHLLRNLERISSRNSIFDYKSGRKALLSPMKGNINEWLEKLLPNTRIILEPKIIGLDIGIQYINGNLSKAINQNRKDITEFVMSLNSIPKKIIFKNRIELRGVIYIDNKTSNKNNETELLENREFRPKLKETRFCALQIFHCNINHFQSLQELKYMSFEIPQTQYTNFISDIEIYHQCWKEGKLFTSYPTSGLVLKINSRKLQKYLGENNVSTHWAFSIN